MPPQDGSSAPALPGPAAAIRPRVVVQCRDRMLGDALVEWCGRQTPFVAVGPAADGAALLRLCRTHRPVLVVLDAEGGACEALAQLPPPRPYVIGLRSSRCPRGSVSASAFNQLIDRSGGLPPLAAALHAFLAHPVVTGTAYYRLTAREAEVLSLLGTGLRTAEIAVLLGLSPRTVDNHRRRIYAKLGVQCVSHAVAAAASAGLLPPPAILPQPVPLTPRERQILELADRGLSTKQTARVLLVSAKTVENTWRHLYGKLGVHGRAQALAIVHSWGGSPDAAPVDPQSS
ncbi:response regulator transcription factor [Catenulispora subtropica]|uniref:HTH luxR-type domain-containing protein n=1 Tax=Catenulispora subtropica TaxID=450798 RepID=A0ABP5DNC9_9ACTN